eukprot:UN03538
MGQKKKLLAAPECLIEITKILKRGNITHRSPYIEQQINIARAKICEHVAESTYCDTNTEYKDKFFENSGYVQILGGKNQEDIFRKCLEYTQEIIDFYDKYNDNSNNCDKMKRTFQMQKYRIKPFAEPKQGWNPEYWLNQSYSHFQGTWKTLEKAHHWKALISFYRLLKRQHEYYIHEIKTMRDR